MDQEINEVIKCIDLISQKGLKSKFSDQFQKSVSQESQVVCKYLGIQSERQSILWSILLSMSLQKNSSIDLDDVSSFLNTSILKVFLYQKDFDELVKRKLLRRQKPSRRRRNTESLNYLNLFVPNNIIYSVVNGEPLPKRCKSDLNIYDILDMVFTHFNEKDDGFIDYDELCSEIVGLLNENKNIPFIRQILNYKLPTLEQIILLVVCQQFTAGNTSVELVGLLKTIISETQRQLQIRKEWIGGRTKLQSLNLVDLESESSFRSDKNIVLASKGRELFGEDQHLFIEQEVTKHSDIILSTSIIEKQLFFNEKEQKSLEFLTDLLKPDNYNSVVNRMKDLGMKPGFTVLFHGSPGTGKTETVNQISRMTGRDIKRVEISETKSKWYGDTEKIIKKLFTSYEKLKLNSEITPILLFNEVDGILKKRQDGNSEISNIESTVVTILLQEFENFEGIMFCTANNTNFDRSFDRRFLHKILFQKPDPTVLSKIWTNRVPILTEKQAMYLADRFDFSGGQIDNICKKIVMKQVLTGITPTLLEIEEFCQEESMDKTVEKRRIGYLV